MEPLDLRPLDGTDLLMPAELLDQYAEFAWPGKPSYAWSPGSTESTCCTGTYRRL